MSSRFLNAAGAAAIAAMLGLSAQTASAQITFPWERSPARLPAGPGAVRRRRHGDADPAAGKPAPATDRPERGTAIPQPPARGSAAPARRRAARAGWPAAGAAQRGRGPASQFSPARRRGSRAIRNKVIRSRRLASRAIRRPNPATTSSRRSPLPRRSYRTRQPRRPAAGAAAMPSTRTRIPTPRARRARSAAARCRCRAKRRPARRAGAVRANRSISAVRAIPVAPCRRPLQPHRHRAAQGPAPAPR